MHTTRISSDTHETVLRVEDAVAGLIGFIAIHSTARGPAAGGLRMRPYGSEGEALEDVLRLSRGMTLKNAAADLPLGGGKAVILGDPAEKTDAQLRSFARAIEGLAGRYWTAEDMGMSPADMAVIRGETRYVAGLDEGAHASGDPSPVTARGVFYAMRVAAEQRWGSPVLEGRRVAIQGLGHVGWHLAKLVRAAGAELVVSDRDAERAAWAATSFGAEVVTPDEILSVPCDILAPCAIGGVLTVESIAKVQAEIVCGAANNQLADDAAGDALWARGILYVPDYVANGGGIVNVATEILGLADRRRFVSDKLAALREMTARILARAETEGVSPHRVADEVVAERLVRQDSAA